MKKIILALCLTMFLFGCGKTVEISSESLTEAAGTVETFGQVRVYDEATDPNTLLGRPNQYLGKLEFSDTRVEQITPNDYLGGDIEYFATSEDTEARFEYLLKFTDASLGAFGLNQYVYKYDTVILRIDYELTQAEAEEYRDVMSEYLGEEPQQSY